MGREAHEQEPWVIKRGGWGSSGDGGGRVQPGQSGILEVRVSLTC